MFRARWKKRGSRLSIKRKWIITGILVSALLIQSFIFIEKNLKPPLMSLAKVRMKQIATQSIHASIVDRISDRTNIEHLIHWQFDHQGKITGFTLNYAEHMRITSETITSVQKILSDLQVLHERIPIGQALGSTVLASFGPDIPVRLMPLGNVKVDLNTRYDNAGINMILIEVYVRVTAEVSVIIPFDTETETVETDIPISYSLVVGDVPTYFFDHKGNPIAPRQEQMSPQISIPPMKTNPPF